MRAGFSDQLLDIAFKFAKVISVLLAMLLVLAFLGGIGWSLKQSMGGSDTEDVRFDKEMNQLKESMSGTSEQARASSGKNIEMSNKLRGKYGDSLGKAMTNAQCSSEQYEGAMQLLTQIATDDDTAPYVGDLVDGAIKWFTDAAAYQKSVGGANTNWYCGNYYWQAQYKQAQLKAAQHKLKMLEIIKGFGFSFMALLAAFGLMVIPAIYRIEESVRNRPKP